MKKILAAFFCLFIGSILLCFLLTSCKTDSESFIKAAGLYNVFNVKSNLYDVVITDVTDGDTVTVRFDYDKPKDCTTEEKVRLIGVDTPEMNYHKHAEPEYYAQEATDYTSTFIKQSALLEFDNVSTSRDKYGRLLAYIWIDSKILNKDLIEKGYGRYYENFAFNSERMTSFAKAQETAQKKRAGMWQ